MSGTGYNMLIGRSKPPALGRPGQGLGHIVLLDAYHYLPYFFRFIPRLTLLGRPSPGLGHIFLLDAYHCFGFIPRLTLLYSH